MHYLFSLYVLLSFFCPALYLTCIPSLIHVASQVLLLVQPVDFWNQRIFGHVHSFPPTRQPLCIEMQSCRFMFFVSRHL
jgi:hypothetical protein